MIEQKLTPQQAEITPGNPDTLLHHNQLLISAEQEWCKPEDLKLPGSLPTGEQLRVLGMFTIDEDNPKYAAIIKTEHPYGSDSRYYVCGLKQGRRGTLTANTEPFLPLTNKSTPFGRTFTGQGSSEEIWPGESYSDTVSRSHMELTATHQGVIIKDMSTNGTAVSYRPSTEDHNRATEDIAYEAVHTMRAEEHAKIMGMLDVEGRNAFGREIISRHTTDPEGKVDIRSWQSGGEAIVVDSLKDPEAYQEMYEKFQEILGAKGAYTEKDVVEAIYDTVSSTMQYDLAFVDTPPDGMDQTHRKVNLSYYLGSGRGVCRHMALACQWLGSEAAKSNPLLKGGSFTTPVNQRKSDNAAHEWARYTSADGKVYILDPAQKFVGTLEESVKNTSGDKWEYFSDEAEKLRYMQKDIGKSTLKLHGIARKLSRGR